MIVWHGLDLLVVTTCTCALEINSEFSYTENNHTDFKTRYYITQQGYYIMTV